VAWGTAAPVSDPWARIGDDSLPLGPSFLRYFHPYESNAVRDSKGPVDHALLHIRFVDRRGAPGPGSRRRLGEIQAVRVTPEAGGDPPDC
jgi:hypothetical protein